MRTYIPSEIPREFDPRLVKILRDMNGYLGQVDKGFSRIQRGESPVSGGSLFPLAGISSHHKLLDLTTFDDHLQYLLLAGRDSASDVVGDYNGQTVKGNVYFQPYVVHTPATSSTPGSGFTSIGSFTATNTPSSGASWNIPITTTAPGSATKVCILAIASDAGVGHSTLTDTQGNVWTKLTQHSGTYYTISVWSGRVTTTLTASVDTLTITFASSTGTKIATGQQFTCGSGSVISLAGSASANTAPSGFPAGDAPSLSVSGLTVREHLFMRFTAIGLSAGSSFSNSGGGWFSVPSSDLSSYSDGIPPAPPTLSESGEFQIATASGITSDPSYAAGTLNVWTPSSASLLVAIDEGTAGAPAVDTDVNLVEVLGTASVVTLNGFIIKNPSTTGRLFFDASTVVGSRYWTLPNWTGIPVVPSNLGTSGYLMVSQGSSQPVWASVASSIDHGVLGGLTDDDHLQYLLLEGRGSGQAILDSNLFLGGTGTSTFLGIGQGSGGSENSTVVARSGASGQSTFRLAPNNVTKSQWFYASSNTYFEFTGNLTIAGDNGATLSAILTSAGALTILTSLTAGAGATFGTAGTNCLVTVGQGAGGSDTSILNIRSGTGNDASLQLSQNATKGADLLWNGTDCYLRHLGAFIIATLSTTAQATFTTAELSLANAYNIQFGTSTGTKIGTATNQRLGFWNATPIIQPTTTGGASTFVANTSLIINDTATWDGYTIGQVVKALRNAGILA